MLANNFGAWKEASSASSSKDNTLHDFYEKGLLKKLMINSERIYFDTNTEHHHHFYSKKDQKLIDINVDMKVSGLPKPPKNKKINKIEVLVHLDN